MRMKRRKKLKAVSENEIATIIVDKAYKVHSELGPGLLETVYEVILARELKKESMDITRQKPIKICWEDIIFDEGFKADLWVEDKVIVELKSVEKLLPVHKKQLLTYLRLTDKRLGLLINFGELYIKNGIKRVVNGLSEE